MASKKFRSGAWKNKYSSPLSSGNVMCFICFSSAEKFLAIFSLALTFSLVLSLVSRQEKELFSNEDLQIVFVERTFDDSCSFSFARPKKTEPKVSALRHPASYKQLLCLSGKKGALRKWTRQENVGNVPSSK